MRERRSGGRGCAGVCAARRCGPPSSSRSSLDAVLLARPADRRRRRAGPRSPRCCSPGFFNLVVVAVGAPLAGAVLRRRRPAGCRASSPTTAPGTVLLAAVTAMLLASGLAHRPGDRGRGARLRPPGRERAALRRSPSAGAEFRANLDGMDTVKQGPDLYRTCVARPRPAALVLRLRHDRPGPARRHARSRPAAERDRQRPGQPGPPGALRRARSERERDRLLEDRLDAAEELGRRRPERIRWSQAMREVHRVARDDLAVADDGAWARACRRRGSPTAAG